VVWSGAGTEVSKGGGESTNDVPNERNDTDDTADKAGQMRVTIAEKKQHRIMEESHADGN